MQKFIDNDIRLIEDIHKYELKDDPEFEFTSCTTFVKYFFEPFDKIGVANNLAGSHPKYLDKTPRQLVEEWDDIAEEGTLIHAEVERFIKENAAPNHPKSKSAVKWIKEYIYEIEKYDIFSEVIVYSKELSLAGTIDLLIYDKMTGTYKLLDWKTNRKIFTSSYDNKTGMHRATANLMDCNFLHYSIQLSLYRYILEKYYSLTVSGSAISHLTEEKVNIYKTEYHKAEVVEMLKADRAALKKRNEECLTKKFV
ncbi:PD-(D/E)XK nuclease family protein [Bacteroidota bacterium]